MLGVAQSEALLGIETDAIVCEVFVRVGLAQELLPGARHAFRQSLEAADAESSLKRRVASQPAR